MNIVIFGAGAIGSLYGAYLSKNNEVMLIGRKSHVNTIRKNGLTISGKTKLNVKISAYDSIDKISSSVDLLILTVKSYDTKTAINQAKEIINNKTIIISLQNGLDNISTIQEIINRNKIIVGITTHGAFFSKPGFVIHTGIGNTILGDLDEKKTDKINKIKKIFDESGLDTHISDNILREIWTKAIVNSSINPVTAFFGCKNGYLLKNPILEKTIENVCEESTLVANSCGIKISYENMIKKTKKIIIETSENQSSMLQSIKKNKKTEINSINGVFVDFGKKYRISTPLNNILISLVSSLSKL